MQGILYKLLIQFIIERYRNCITQYRYADYTAVNEMNNNLKISGYINNRLITILLYQ